ncbi:unnamed protein product [Spirodela intermedia]|uniref:Peroxidase n=1 Tax=Spirodela intermedia TaxID=51605 RepID=A0A7I8ISQ6_SPIIN|nr:unnamed protein product [Spirodela intermedia]CAA6660560.1 unnamed protein product [Spirodela intermedia]
MASASTFLLLALAAFPLLCTGATAFDYPPLVKGLSWTFYKSSCPKAESIVRNYLKTAIKRDVGLAAGLLRIHFHDCFVQGCDGSVLLDGTDGEKFAPPNLSLRQSGFNAINDIRNLLQKECGRVVSCADIAALAARDSVFLVGGPDYKVPTGRRDGLTFASRATTLDFLPPPSSNLKLDTNDLVALSGGHTIGIGHCPSFTDRLYPTQDPVMDKTFANNLKRTCPERNTDNETVLDIRSPNVFDNKLFHTDSRTKDLVISFAIDQSLFFEKFVYSMTKMGMLNVLTGSQGEIRANCSIRNPSRADEALSTLVDGDGEAAAF